MDLAELVRLKGGQILAGPYRDERGEHVRVACAAGHEWAPRVANLLYCGSWCPACYGNQRLTIGDMRRLAEERGGACVSEEYGGNKVPLEWECSEGHRWRATPNNVKNLGSWCPHCRINIAEELTRAAFEEATGRAFVRTRSLPWLDRLELDGYCEHLGLAFEYQGIQHFEHVPFFHQDTTLEEQQERDRRKRGLCEENGVKLFEVPYNVGIARIRDHVRELLADAGYELLPAADAAEFFARARRRPRDADVEALERLRAKCAELGGVLLADAYHGRRAPVRVRCREGHEFDATADGLLRLGRARFCPDCGGTKKKPDAVLAAEVAKTGYTFVGVESVAALSGRRRRYLTLDCPEGHRFRAMTDNFFPLRQVPGGWQPNKGCSDCFNARRKNGGVHGAPPRPVYAARQVPEAAPGPPPPPPPPGPGPAANGGEPGQGGPSPAAPAPAGPVDEAALAELFAAIFADLGLGGASGPPA